MTTHSTDSWIMVAHVLDCVVKHLDTTASLGEGETRVQSSAGEMWTFWQGIEKPQISLKDYMRRLSHYSSCSDSCFVIVFIYIERLLQKNSRVRLSGLNVHR